MALDESATLKIEHFEVALSLYHFNPAIAQVKDLSLFEVLMLLGVRRTIVDKRLNEFHFEAVFKEYMAFYSLNTHVLVNCHIKRDAGWRAFEMLVSLGILQSIGGAKNGCSKEYRMHGSLMDVTEILQGLNEIKDQLPTPVYKWGCI